MGKCTVKELADKVMNNKYHVEPFVALFEILLDLDFNSVENYLIEKEFRDVLDVIFEDDIYTLVYIKTNIEKMENQLARDAFELLRIETDNPYLIYLKNALKAFIDGNIIDVENNNQLNDHISLTELGILLFTEIKFNDKNKKRDWDIFIDALKNDQAHMIKAFYLENESIIYFRDYYNNSLLHICAELNSQNTLEYLLSVGMDVDYMNYLEQTPLHVAVNNNNYESLKILISFRAKLDIKDENGNTPLHLACYLNHVETVLYLIEFGSHLTITNNAQLNPLYAAIYNDHVDLVEKMYHIYKENKIISKMELLHVAARFDSLKSFEWLVSMGLDMNCLDKHLNTPLHKAIFTHSNKVANYLISLNVNTEAENINGNRPLEVAIINQNIEIFKLLIKKEKNIHKTSKKGWNLLHLAIVSNQYEICQYLIDNGVDVCFKTTKEEYSPLRLAAEAGSFDIFKLLVEAGANINERTKSKTTILHYAVYNNNVNIVKYLIEQGVDLNEKNNRGYRAIHFAVENDNIEITRLLIQKGVFVDVNNLFGEVPLSLANQNNIEMIKLLLEAGGNPSYKSIINSSPYEKAIKKKNKEVISLYNKKLKSKPINKDKLFLNVVWILIGVYLLTISIENTVNYYRLYKNGVVTIGSVSELKVNDKKYQLKYAFEINSKSYKYNHVFVYKDDWIEISKEDYENFDIGDSISVKYLINNPKVNYPLFDDSNEYKILKSNMIWILVYFVSSGFSFYEGIRKIYTLRKIYK